MSKFGPQVIEEITGQSGYTHRFDFSHVDLTQVTANTAQSLKVFVPARAGDKIKHVALFLEDPFQNTADAAFNSTTISVGDSGDVDNMIVAIECNKNGTLGTFPAEDTGDGLPYTVPATPLEIDVTVNAMSGKSLVNLNVGRAYVLIHFFRQTEAGLAPGTPNPH